MARCRAPSPATAAFLHVQTHVMCLCHALGEMRARSGVSSKPVSRSRLESITSSRCSQAVKAPVLLRTQISEQPHVWTMQGVERLPMDRPHRLHTISVHSHAHLAIPLETGNSPLTLG
jgi:hypothetical protein